MRPTFQLADGTAYRATLRTADSPAVPLAPSLGVRALAYGALPSGVRPSALAFGHPSLPLHVSLDPRPDPASGLPQLRDWSRFEARAPDEPFDVDGGRVTIWVDRIEWPQITLAVRNDGPRPFPIYADHRLRALAFTSSGGLVPLEAVSLDILTTGVPSGGAARYSFRAASAAPPGDARLLVAVAKELTSERDVQGLAVYALDRQLTKEARVESKTAFQFLRSS